MPVEIEAKMAVDNLDVVRDRLRDAGATPQGRFLEMNVFLDTEDRSLLAADEGLRLRVNRNMDGSHAQHVITYKGPRQMGPLKSREEVELNVDSGPDAIALLEKLGFLKMLSFEKRRESWRLENCKVELDELPHLGRYVEVEGPGEEAVFRVRNILGLSDRPIVKASYVSLLLAHLQERGNAERVVTFAEVGQR